MHGSLPGRFQPFASTDDSVRNAELINSEVFLLQSHRVCKIPFPPVFSSLSISWLDERQLRVQMNNHLRGS